MQYRGHRHEVTIAGKTFWVDSNQEETLIRWLEANGFHDRWRYLENGLNVKLSNYTPDLELSIQLDGMTHRALVESKPYKAAFNAYISKRMRGVAAHYFTKILLLYVHDENNWYRIDHKTGDIQRFGKPIPGEIPIRKLYKPFTVSAKRVYSHTYRKRLELGKKTAAGVANVLDAGIKAFFGPTKRRRKKYRKKR